MVRYNLSYTIVVRGFGLRSRYAYMPGSQIPDERDSKGEKNKQLGFEKVRDRPRNRPSRINKLILLKIMQKCHT